MIFVSYHQQELAKMMIIVEYELHRSIIVDLIVPVNVIHYQMTRNSTKQNSIEHSFLLVNIFLLLFVHQLFFLMVRCHDSNVFENILDRIFSLNNKKIKRNSF
jgi:hypothetical protein